MSQESSKPPDRQNQQPIAEPRNLPPNDEASRRGGDTYRRAMQGQGTGGYGGQYAGLAAGLHEEGGRIVPEQPSALGTYGANGGAPSASAADLARDVEIHAAIAREIERHLGPEGRQIELKVVCGEAFLDGEVTNTTVSRQAADIVTRLGASRVVNNLRIALA